jgi:hypothetical protein
MLRTVPVRIHKFDRPVNFSEQLYGVIVLIGRTPEKFIDKSASF